MFMELHVRDIFRYEISTTYYLSPVFNVRSFLGLSSRDCKQYVVLKLSVIALRLHTDISCKAKSFAKIVGLGFHPTKDHIDSLLLVGLPFGTSS